MLSATRCYHLPLLILIFSLLTACGGDDNNNITDIDPLQAGVRSCIDSLAPSTSALNLSLSDAETAFFSAKSISQAESESAFTITLMTTPISTNSKFHYYVSPFISEKYSAQPESIEPTVVYSDNQLQTHTITLEKSLITNKVLYASIDTDKGNQNIAVLEPSCNNLMANKPITPWQNGLIFNYDDWIRLAYQTGPSPFTASEKSPI